MAQGKSVRTKKKRGRGRPARSSQPADLRLEVRVSADELKTLAEAAGAVALPVSTWVRDRSLEAAQRELAASRRPVPATS